MKQSCRPRKPGEILILSAFLLAIVGSSCTLEPPLKLLPDKQVKITGGGMRIELHSLSGRVTSIVEEHSDYDLLRPWPETDRAAAFGIEIYDELELLTCCDLRDSVKVRNFVEEENSAFFEKRVCRAEYSLKQKVWGDREGVYMNFQASVTDKEAPLRSVRFSYLIPLPKDFYFWVPNGREPLLLDGRTGAKFIYGPGGEKDASISIPLVSIWKAGGPAFSLAVPLEIRSVRVSFTVEPARLPEGVSPGPAECDWLRITFDLVGMGEGRTLETALWLYAHEDDWRSSLGIFAEKYGDYFQPSRRLSSAEGFLSRITPTGCTNSVLAGLQRREVKLAKIDWNYYRSGQWVPPQALRFDDFTWTSNTVPQYDNISVTLVRSCIENLVQFKLRSVLYSPFNSYCSKEISGERFADDTALDENGRPMVYRESGLLMHAAAGSPFGREMIEQQRRMLDLYPQADGFFFDDWGTSGIDFARDDSLTVVHNRAAYSLSGNRSQVGRLLVDMVNQQKKLVFATPPPSISECRGIDVLCLAGPDLENLGRIAFMGLLRPIVADLGPETELSTERAEEILKEELLWGVIPSETELSRDFQLARAYRPLFLNLKGREWILEPHALGLTPGLKGQVFYIPANSRDTEQDVVVCILRPDLRLADDLQRGGARVRLRLPEAEEYLRATLTLASRNPWPMPLRIERKGEEDEQELLFDLPQFGPAALLRLYHQ